MAQITAERTDESTAVLRFVNPPEGFLTPQMLPALMSEFAAAAADPTVRAIVLTGGTPRVFIQHYWDPEAPPAEAGLVPEAFPGRLRELCDRIESCEKPVIAAINGTCLGGGLELALACDFRVVQTGDYSIGATEIHLGLLPGAGGVTRLVRLVGAARAFEMIALGMTFSPEDAVAQGFVSFAAPHALEASLKLARQLAAKPAKALANLKALVSRAAIPAPGDAEALEAEALCLELWASREATTRMAAFNRGEFDVRDGYPGETKFGDTSRSVAPREGPSRARPKLRIV